MQKAAKRQAWFSKQRQKAKTAKTIGNLKQRKNLRTRWGP
jgi:hypothetical protein